MSSPRFQDYTRLPAIEENCVRISFEDEASTSNETSETGLIEKQEYKDAHRRGCTSITLLTQLNILLFLISMVSLGLGVLPQAGLDHKCLRLHSAYSPALTDIDPVYTGVEFNGTLNQPSMFRGDPSPEVDAAWDDIEDVRPMSITEEELIKLGKTTDAIKVPSQFGGGYIASVELNHQIHCLNFLRKSLFRDYYAPPSPHASVEFTDEPAMVATHQGHCVEMLRQFIMCHADVGIITHRWVKDFPRPYPDFNTFHQCRNFESALQWTKSKQWSEEDGGLPRGWTFTPGEGEVVLDVPP